MAAGLLEAVDPRREELNAIFLLLGPYVYFQAPSNVNMQYPCIRYEQDDEEKLFANNLPYSVTRRYQVTVIDEDPDSMLRTLVSGLPMCKFNRHFVADDLHHYVFTLFF